jgi:ribulose-phosphate 3-epimerase
MDGHFTPQLLFGPETVRALAARRPAGLIDVHLVVDGGIRPHTVARIARAGADGVVPGSLVFGDADWLAGVRFIHAQPTVETP